MKRRISILLIACLLLGGCRAEGFGRGDGTASEYRIPESEKLVIYTSHKEEVYEPIVKEFEERTGIYVEVKQGATLGLFDEIAANAGNETCDVIFGGGVENYVAYQNYLDAYRVSGEDAIDERYRTPNHKWTAFSVLPIVFIYNNKLVYPVGAPRTWEELRTGRWKGKVAFADPATSGSSYTALCTMIQAEGGEIDQVMGDFSETLAGHISGSSGAVLDEVNSGERLVGITLEETARKRISRGADLSIIYPAEGTSAVPDAAAIVQGAPHRENARRFLDFTVSEDVQRLLSDAFFRQPVRSDIRLEKDADQKEDEVKLLDYDVVWAAECKDEILGKWELFREEQAHNR